MTKRRTGRTPRPLVQGAERRESGALPGAGALLSCTLAGCIIPSASIQGGSSFVGVGGKGPVAEGNVGVSVGYVGAKETTHRKEDARGLILERTTLSATGVAGLFRYGAGSDTRAGHASSSLLVGAEGFHYDSSESPLGGGVSLTGGTIDGYGERVSTLQLSPFVLLPLGPQPYLFLQIGAMVGVSGMGEADTTRFVGGVSLGVRALSPFYGTVWSPSWSFVRTRSGRPVRDERGAQLLAPCTHSVDWCGAVHDAPTEPISQDTRARIGEAWLSVARDEHAAVASFSLLALSLIELGAPPALVDGAHRAAREEVEHARLAFSLASQVLESPIGPGPFALERAKAAPRTLEAIVCESLVDGALGEGIGASAARAAARRATWPAARRALTRIARQEASHARLGWEIVEWGLRATQGSLVAPLLAAWASARGKRPRPMGVPDAVAVAHGVVSPDMVWAARVRVERAAERRLLALVEQYTRKRTEAEPAHA